MALTHNTRTISVFLRGFTRVAGLLGSIILVMAVFAALSHGLFLLPTNLVGLLRYAGSLAIMGFGLTAVLLVGEIDLSFANLYGLSTMSMAVAWIAWGWPLALAIAFAFGIAIVVGAFNAFFTTVVGVPSFIATLGSSILIFGLTLLISNSETFSPASPPTGQTIAPGEVSFFSQLSGAHLPFNIPMQAIWMLVVALIFWVLIHRSLFGFRLKAIGGNEIAARYARIPNKRYKFYAFIIAALTAALAGLLDFSYIGSVQPTAGQSLLFPVFAAVVIGGASLAGGRGNVGGSLLGALLLAIIANGLAVLAAGAFAQQIFLGAATIAAVVLDQASQRWQTRRSALL